MKTLRSPFFEARKVCDELWYKEAWNAKAEDYNNDFSVGENVGETDQKGKIEDIVNLFYNRFESITEILRSQAGFKASGTIKQIWKEKKRTKDYNIVGIVLEVKRTKSGGKMVTLEDMTGIIRVFVRKDDPASAVIMNDDVLGVTGRFDKQGGEMFWVSRVIYPDILSNNINKGGEDYDPISIAFISDLHMGSKEFLEKEWDGMMAWLNTNDPVAKNIKWLVLSGDIIDGIGIYPGHEENICIANSFDQYEFCARKLDHLPAHITPIILPGNHDAVRPAEPQPQFETNVQQKFNSTIFTGNPARINLSGIDVLSYHGKGLDDIIPRIEEVTYEEPHKGMELMLKKRHLAPLWGERNALSPEEEDQMIIRRPPDIFVTGHTHAHNASWHKGIPLIVSSTFQNETDFMRMMGSKPKKGFLTIYNIRNREIKVKGFVDNVK